MPKIFISYRRSDSDAISGRIRDRLAAHYGPGAIYMDVDSIPFGLDFRDHVRSALESNEMLIAVVGPRWIGPQKGGPRIKASTDPVRFEVETALNIGMPVIPVLVGGGTMPQPNDLPPELAHFSFRNAAPVDSGRDFHLHMDRLIAAMDTIFTDRAAAAAISGATTREPPALSPSGTTLPAAPAELPSNAPPLAAAPTSTAPQFAGTPIEVPAEALPELPLIRAVELVPRVEDHPEAAAPPPEVTHRPPAAAADSVPRAAPIKGGGIRTGWLAVLALACAAVGGGVYWYTTRPPQAVQPGKQPAAVAQAPRQPADPIATACSPSAPAAFRDDFKTARPHWDLSEAMRGSTGYYANGQLVIKAAEKASMGVLYTAQKFTNITVCAHVKSPKDERTMASTGGGVVFWARDSNRYYVASIHPDGSYGIYRFGIGSASVVVPRARFESVKPGLDLVNEIILLLIGNNGRLYINGHKVQDFQGEAPEGGGAVGLWGQSQEDLPNEWRFADFSVVELPP